MLVLTVMDVVQNAKNVLASNKFRLFIFCLFIFQAFFLALTVRIGVPPDEMTHIAFIEEYASQDKITPFITKQQTYFEGDFTREISYLYHFVLSLFLRGLSWLNQTNQYVILRFLSVGIATAALVFVAKTADELNVSKLATNVSLFVLSQTSGYLLIASAINNDNLVWLAVSLCCYFAIKLALKNEQIVRNFLSLGVVIGFGSLVKDTFLPIGLFFTVYSLIVIFYKKKYLHKSLKCTKPVILFTLSFLLIASVGLVGERHIGNLTDYGSLDPKCSELHSLGDCYEFGLLRRVEEHSNIEPMPASLSLLQFTPKWLLSMAINIFGTQNWIASVFAPIWSIVALTVLFLLSILISIYQVKIKTSKDKLKLMLFGLGISYVVLVMFINYFRAYHNSGRFGIALQGRYIFPILAPFLIVVASYVKNFFAQFGNKAKQIGLAAGICVMMLVTLNSGLAVILKTSTFTDGELIPRYLRGEIASVGHYDLTK